MPQPPGNPEAVNEIQFSLEILPVTYSWQHRHGIRHGDFLNYRHFCSRKIQKIRKSLQFPLFIKNKVVNKKVSMDALKDIRYLWVVLLNAERAWSYANELKQDANTEPRKRFRQLAKLKKASLYAKELNCLITKSDKCDARSKIESLAYYHWSIGNLYFERGDWNLCVNHLHISQDLYQELCAILSATQVIPYQQRRDEIATAIRFARYNLERSATKAEPDKKGGAKKGNLKGEKLGTCIDKNELGILIEGIVKGRKKNLIEIKNIFTKAHSQPSIQVESDKIRDFLRDALDLEKKLIKSFAQDEATDDVTGEIDKLHLGEEKALSSVEAKVPCSRKRTRLDPNRFEGVAKTLAIYDALLSACSGAIKSLKASQNSSAPTTHQANTDNLAALEYYLEYVRMQYLLGRRIYRYVALLLPMTEKKLAKKRGKVAKLTSATSAASRWQKKWTPLLVSNCTLILECVASLKLILSNAETNSKQQLIETLGVYEDFFEATRCAKLANLTVHSKANVSSFDKALGLFKKAVRLSTALVKVSNQSDITALHLEALVDSPSGMEADSPHNLPGFEKHIHFPGLVTKAKEIAAGANKHLDDVKINRVISVYQDTAAFPLKGKEASEGKGGTKEEGISLLDIINGQGHVDNFVATADIPIAPMPPPMVAVQCCKPAFFDLAYNQLIDRQTSLLETFERLAHPDANASENQGASSSLGGLVKNWFWAKK